MKRTGARQVSSEAVEELRSIIEEIAFDISKRAVLFADNEARLKVNREDMVAATKEFLEPHR